MCYGWFALGIELFPQWGLINNSSHLPHILLSINQWVFYISETVTPLSPWLACSKGFHGKREKDKQNIHIRNQSTNSILDMKINRCTYCHHNWVLQIWLVSLHSQHCCTLSSAIHTRLPPGGHIVCRTLTGMSAEQLSRLLSQMACIPGWRRWWGSHHHSSLSGSVSLSWCWY